MTKSKKYYRNILLVDDDRIFILKYHKIFSRITHQADIEFSMSATTGLAKLQEMHEKGDFPELITLDWMLKMGGGEHFLKGYKQKFAALYPQTKILVISGVADEINTKKQAEYAFVQGVLPKPVSMKDLSGLL